jgi:hypothetical protein
MTQTGMNSSQAFDFSLDNDRPDLNNKLIPILDSAAKNAWKVSLHYVQVWGCRNFLWNRGETSYYIDSVEVLDKNPLKSVFNKTDSISKKIPSDTIWSGVRDTIYVVITKNSDK